MEQFDCPGSVARSVAKSEIEALFHRYAVLAKENAPFDEMATLYHADGLFRLPNGFAVRPAEMAQVVKDNDPDFIRHHITSVDIQFLNSNEAHAQSFFFAITHKSSLDHWGYWEDVVTRHQGGNWLIKERKIIVEGGDPKGWYKTTYP